MYMEQPNDKNALKTIIEQLLSDKTQLPEGEVMQLVDIIPIIQLQPLQDEFALANGITAIILDTDGKPVTKPSNSKQKSINTDINRFSERRSQLSQASAPIYVCGQHVADFKIEMCGFGDIIGPFLEAAYENENIYNHYEY